jgi:CRP-like cAMP-binding protein
VLLPRQGKEPMAGSTTRNTPNNHLLLALSTADFALLAHRLNPVRLGLLRSLEDANKPIRHVYFPETGIVSVVAASTRDRQSEVGLIGREGMTGINVVMGDDRSPHLSYVQAAGRGQRMKADDLRQAMQTSASMRNCFLHFAQAFMVQAAHTAVANGRGKLEERLARWLLMVHDRLEGNELPLTHEFIALMLNVRRAGVTEAVQGLTRKGLVSAKRGRIIVKDRVGLVAKANGLYGIPESEYLRLTGWKATH